MKARAGLVLVILGVVGLAFSALPAYATGSVVFSATCNGCNSITANSIVTGDLIVAIVGDTTASVGGSHFTVMDTFGNNFQPAVEAYGTQGTYCGAAPCFMGIFYAQAITSGSGDSVSFTDPGQQVPHAGSIQVFVVSGTSNHLDSIASGSYTCSPSVSCTATTSTSTSFSSYGFLVGGLMGACNAGVTAGESGYTAVSQTQKNVAAIYSVTGVSSPTSYSFHMTCSGDTGSGPIVGAIFGLPGSSPTQSTTTSTSTVTATATTTTSTVCTSSTTTTTTVTTTLTVTTTVQQLTYTVTTDPPGLASSIQVDGTLYNSPQTFTWQPGSVHTIQARSPCNLAHSPYTSFTFVSWSDGGSQTHSVTAPTSSTVYTAKFATTATSVSCGSPNPLQQLERACIVPALLTAWSSSIGLQPWLGFILLGINVAIYNKTQSVWVSICILWITGATFFLFLPPYVSLIAQIFLYLGVAGIVVKGVLLVR